MDDRLAKAWREYVTQGSAETALSYCREVARAGQAPATATPLNSIDWESFGSKHEAVKAAICSAGETFIGGEPHEVCLEDLHWLTECHYWALGESSPSTMRLITAVYEQHDLKLKQGDEEEAERDHRDANEDTSNRLANLKARRKIKKLQQKTTAQEREIENLKFNAKQAKVRERLAEARKADDFNASGMQAVNLELRKENERLARLVQEANRGKKA